MAQKIKTCERCDLVFLCGVEKIESCWCSELDLAALPDLDQFDDCICRACISTLDSP